MSIESLKLELKAWDKVNRKCNRFVSYAKRGARRDRPGLTQLRNLMVIYRYALLCLPFKPHGLVFSTYAPLFGSVLTDSKRKLRLRILWLLVKGCPYGFLPFLVFPWLVRYSSLKSLLDGCFYSCLLSTIHRVAEERGRRDLKGLEKDIIRNAKVLGTPIGLWMDEKAVSLLVSREEIKLIYET